MSYLDVEWIHRKQLEDKIGKVRVRKFIEKFLYTQTNWSVDEIFNPNFTKVNININIIVKYLNYKY